MATARSIRSNAAPASNRPHTKHQSSSRPELRVVSNPRGNEQGNVVGRVIEWTRTRSAPLVHVAIAVIFLVGTLFGALMLRTQMVQNSFEAAQIETNINRLTQDIEDDQAKLDQFGREPARQGQRHGHGPAAGISVHRLKRIPVQQRRNPVNTIRRIVEFAKVKTFAFKCIAIGAALALVASACVIQLASTQLIGAVKPHKRPRLTAP